MNRLFGANIPKYNKWAKKDAYFCDEVYEALEDIGLPKVNITTGMESPEDLWLKLKEIYKC